MTKVLKSAPIQFRAGELHDSIQSRVGEGQSAGQHAREALERYYTLLRDELASLRGVFTLAEAMLLCDAGNGVEYASDTLGGFAIGIEDAISLDGLDRKWGVDGAVLLDKLQSLSLLGNAALVDLVERYWIAVSQGQVMEHEAKTFQRLGLVLRVES